MLDVLVSSESIFSLLSISQRISGLFREKRSDALEVLRRIPDIQLQKSEKTKRKLTVTADGSKQHVIPTKSQLTVKEMHSNFTYSVSV